ncbi:hypothetical protein [Roseovarius marisflavi]|uniref:hypothetical protein n=1 Tax=Roseovarius marisflavi TaxID=1054996 RepID=UPI001C6554DC|nr:hypothetical protein [Roseovarius marisflavi]
MSYVVPRKRREGPKRDLDNDDEYFSHASAWSPLRAPVNVATSHDASVLSKSNPEHGVGCIT